MNPWRVLWFTSGLLKAGKVRGWLFWGVAFTYLVILCPGRLLTKITRRVEKWGKQVGSE